MRVIEEKMLRAIKNKRDWQERNTRVRVYDNGYVVWLYSTPIFAQIDGAEFVCDGGWRTRTTQSRLNALGVPYSTNARLNERRNVDVIPYNRMKGVMWHLTR